MAAVRVLGIMLSLMLHAVLAVPFLTLTESAALDESSGDDTFTIEQGIAVEGLLKLGDEQATTEAQEAPLTEASRAQPAIEEVKASETVENPKRPEAETATDVPLEVITAKDLDKQDSVEPSLAEAKPEEVKSEKPVEQPIIEDESPPELDEPRPKQEMAVQQIEQAAIREQQSSSEEKTGGDATIRAAYLGKLRLHIEGHKVNPRTKVVGTAVVEFTVNNVGELISRRIVKSSGYKALDDAAMASIDKASPFPVMPEALNRQQIEVSVPFKFKVR